MNNLDIAYALLEIADLLELKGEEVFKVRAYRKAAEAVELTLDEVAALARQGRLTTLPGVGKAIAEKITELVTTGGLGYLNELRKAVPPGVAALTRVPGLGVKTAQVLFGRLGIDSLERLEEAAKSGKLRDIPGVGAKKEAAILSGLQKLRERAQRAPVGVLRPVAEALVEHLRLHPAVLQADIAGDIRRQQELVAEVELVAAAHDPAPVLDFVARLPITVSLVEREPARIRVQTSFGRDLVVTVSQPDRYALTLLERTGSAAHVAALGPLEPWPTEQEIYAHQGMHYIEPELRENLGEIEAARSGRLPNLIQTSDIKGDLHTHTRASDGTATAEEMAAAAEALGHHYLGICDHSRSLAIAGGLSAERLALQGAQIRALNQAQETSVALLSGTEVDILKDGSLDFPDQLLRDLDVVVASIHSHMRLGQEEQTERLVQAIKNPHVDVIGHPTGRVLQRRDAYPLDFERVLEACGRTDTALEISASPARLDLNDLHARLAKHRGVKLVINTDAHAVSELSLLGHGVASARRAWVEPQDVINCMELAPLKAWLSKEKG